MTEKLPEHVDRFLAEARLENERLRKRVEARKDELHPGAVVKAKVAEESWGMVENFKSDIDRFNEALRDVDYKSRKAKHV